MALEIHTRLCHGGEGADMAIEDNGVECREALDEVRCAVRCEYVYVVVCSSTRNVHRKMGSRAGAS